MTLDSADAMVAPSPHPWHWRYHCPGWFPGEKPGIFFSLVLIDSFLLSWSKTVLPSWCSSLTHSLTHSLFSDYLFIPRCLSHSVSHNSCYELLWEICLLYKDDILLCVDIVGTSMYVWKISKFMSWQSHAKLLNLYSKYAFSGSFVP